MRSMKEYTPMSQSNMPSHHASIPEVNDFRFKTLKFVLVGVTAWFVSSLIS